METSVFKKYLQSIEDFVFIENKIITYLWLCQVLKIHVNTAKQLLYAFSNKEDMRNKLLITYVLGGEMKNGKGKLLKLVIADSREAVEQLFSKITTSHIFSIQRSGGTFSSIDIFNSYPHFSIPQETRKFCSIQPSKVIDKREVNHITEAKNFLNTNPPKKANGPKVSEGLKKDIDNVESKKITADEITTYTSESKLQQKKTANDKDVKNKTGSIGSFFSRQAEKKSLELPAENKEKSNKKEKKIKTGIGAFFKPENKNDSSIKGNDTNHNIETISTLKKHVENETNEHNGIENPVIALVKDKKPKSKDKKRKRKKKNEAENGVPKKRRKRILSTLSSDSESSGIESNECEMEIEPEQPPPPPPVEEDEEDIIPPTPGRKRVRKQIDKIFEQEEGFFLTSKEFVYESCSDEEAKVEKKKNQENISNENKPSVQKTPENKKEISPTNTKKNKSKNDKDNKQSSITNFFKRKATC